MATSVAQFRTRFREFSDSAAIPDDRVQLFLDDAVLEMDANRWGTKFDIGQAYLAAHMLYIDELANLGGAIGGGGAGNAGPKTGKTVDKVSTTHGVNVAETDAIADGELLSTTYGRRYLRYRDQIKVPGFLVINSINNVNVPTVT